MKPCVFLSHSSGDAETLLRLKDMLVEKTSETIEFFLSSDDRSMKAGLNWTEEIFKTLSKSLLLSEPALRTTGVGPGVKA
jgi:hypothetical protein